MKYWGIYLGIFASANNITIWLSISYIGSKTKILVENHLNRGKRFHIGNIHKQITALIYNILQFKYIVAEVTANGIQLVMSKKYYHHYLLG